MALNEPKREIEVEGTLSLDDSKVYIQLTGARAIKGDFSAVESLSARTAFNQTVKLVEESQESTHGDYSNEDFSEVTNISLTQRKHYHQELADFLMNLPEVKHPDSLIRRKLFQLILNKKKVRHLLNAPPLKNPEKDMELLIGRVIDALDSAELDDWLSQIGQRLNDNKQKSRLEEIQINILAQSRRTEIKPEKQSINIHQLRENIYQNFTIEEISVLCFDLDIKFEDVPGVGLNAKTVGLVQHLNHRGMLDDCLRYCMKVRPRINWDVYD